MSRIDRHRAIWAVVALLIGGAPPCLAQNPGVANDLLTRARAAYDGIRYAQVDSLTQAILRIPNLKTSQRLLALQLRAAALYPEEAGLPKDRDGAIKAIADVIRITFDQKLPRELSWPGLDSLFDVAWKATFAARAKPDHEYVLTGPGATAPIPVRSTRSATFRLVYVTPNGLRQPIDSAGPATSAELKIRGLTDTVVSLPAGAGELQLIATDVLTEESITLRYPMTVTAPTLGLSRAPVPLMAKDFKPERRSPSRVKGIVLGILTAGATIALSSVARGPDNLKSAFSADARAVTVGIGVGVATIAAGFLDPGAKVPENIQTNAALRSRYEQDVEGVRIQNARLLADYRIRITFDSEAP
jgi:hypothetical protein